MKTASVYFVTDGRLSLLQRTLESFSLNVKYPFKHGVIINDCIDDNFRKEVDKLCAQYGLMPHHHDEKKGFSGAYNSAFYMMKYLGSDYYFGCEDDFLFNEEISIQRMIDILEYDRNLVQVCLKRQAWSIEEKIAGGIIEKRPDDYANKEFGDLKWCEHRLFFSTNPNLAPRWVIERGWDIRDSSEGMFGIELFQNPNYKSAFLGHKFDEPKVTHIGEIRNGHGY
jgi:hypothetical protein